MPLIADNLALVRERIARAAVRSGSTAESIKLVVVTKTVDVPRIQEAIAAGASDIGENYVQEAEAKWREIGRGVKWHFIGHLQRNKSKAAVTIFDTIESVDSIELAEEIGRRARHLGKVQDVLVEVSISEEATKFGVEPAGALASVGEIANVEGLRVRGLMGMAPLGSDPEQARPYFRKLRELWDRLPEEQRRYLSMGMTGDFEVAIEEGANMVRIGTAIFGPRIA
jgi:PLP dependent protein